MAPGTWVRGVRFAIIQYLSAGIAISLWSQAASAQGNPTPERAPGSTSLVTAITSVELWLAGAVILFGVVVLTMQFILLSRAAHTTAEDILRLFTVTMVVVGTMALIAVGYSSQQIAPALGLFGTLLGYLLGKTDERLRPRSPPGAATTDASERRD